MSLLNWSDACAYADWSGLRPMTEMEFEKCARGPLFPVAGEFAWGSAAIHASTYTLQNAGMAGESISNPGQGVGNAMYSLTSAGISRPLRCGIFAASAVNVDRIETGASYYGIMELSGNAFERCVTLGNAVARNFDGSHGDGLLSTDGFADSPNWPGQSGGIVQTGAGSGHRGGAATYFRESCQVSSRYYAAYSDNYRNSAFGFRAVRSAD